MTKSNETSKSQKIEINREIRPFEQVRDAADIATVSHLAVTIWSEHYTPIIGKAQVDYMLRELQSEAAIERQIQEGYHYYLIRKDNEPIGYIGFLPNYPPGELFLSKLYVAPSHRNQGIGAKAIDFVTFRAKELGLNAIWLTTNRHNRSAIEAYRRWGFVHTESLVQDIGGGFVMDDYKFRKPVW